MQTDEPEEPSVPSPDVSEIAIQVNPPPEAMATQTEPEGQVISTQTDPDYFKAIDSIWGGSDTEMITESVVDVNEEPRLSTSPPL
ncbi:MAG: hypothetical protein V2I33_21995 [Kangiellaceae bacterium]|jgi:hypothetical protein|nr:hypothetical protein [Kangiellaceae bacterium]